jgi:hypothetical protein
MNYCASCGKEIKYDAVKEGKVSYHPRCFNLVAKIEVDTMVKSISHNRVKSEMRDLHARLSMINTPTLQLVKR